MLIKTIEIVRENWAVACFYRKNEASIIYAKSVFGETCKLGAAAWNEKCLYYWKEMDKYSKSSKYFQSSWKMTLE